MTAHKRIEAPAGPSRAQATVLLTLREVATRLRLGLRSAMALRAAGRLRVLRFGRAVRAVPGSTR